MADTRADVVVPKGVWTNLYSTSGIAVGTAVSVYNKGSANCLIAIKATAPTASTAGVPLYAGANGSYASVPTGQTGLWCYSLLGTSLLVQE